MQNYTISVHPVLLSSLRDWAEEKKDFLTISIHHGSKSPLRDVQENLPAQREALRELENFLNQLKRSSHV